ncbi:MAG: Bis-ABC ATPase SCO6512, partial [uncultured Corynebacteriales bacterium]
GLHRRAERRLHAVRRPRPVRRRVLPGRGGQQDRPDRRQRHRQDHAAADDRRRPAAEHRHHRPQGRTRGHAAVHRLRPGRHRGAGPAARAVRSGPPRQRRPPGPDGAGDDGARRRAGPDGVRAGAGGLGRRRRLRGGDALGRLHHARAGPVLRRVPLPEGRDPVRRRAEAAGAGGPAARHRPGAAARRAGQLPRRARQALAGTGAGRVAEDGPAGQSRPGVAGQHHLPAGHPGGTRRVGARRRHQPGHLGELPEGPAGPPRAAGRAAPALGRGARAAAPAGPHAPGTGQDQPGDGVEAGRDRDPARPVRSVPAAGRAAGRAEGHDAAARRPYRGAGAGLRVPRAHRSHAALRPGRGLRGAHRGAGQQRLRQVALPPPARRPAGRAHRGRTARRPGGARLVRPDPRAAPTRRPDGGGDPAPRRGRAVRTRPGRCDGCAAPLRVGCRRGPDLPVAVRRPAGAAAGAAAGAVRLHDAAAGRADGQPGPGLRRGAGAGAAGFRRHGAGGHARSLVRPGFRALPGLRRRRPRVRVERAGVGRGEGRPGPV